MNWFHLLTVIFVVAKLADVIAWSWWLVFAPSIFSVAFGLAIMAFAFIAVVIAKS